MDKVLLSINTLSKLGLTFIFPQRVSAKFSTHKTPSCMPWFPCFPHWHQILHNVPIVVMLWGERLLVSSPLIWRTYES